MSESVTVEWDSAGDGTFATNITSYVLDIRIKRGRMDDLSRMPPGTATLILKNDGRFSPDKSDGPYYGNLEPYRAVRIKSTVSGTTYGLFFGFVLDMDNKPRMGYQTVAWYLGDRFALWQYSKLSLPLMRKVPIQCALDLAVNRAAGDNECDNSSVEDDLTDYSGQQSVTPVRDSTMKIEGDYTVLCDCPGDNAGEGLRYDATGQVNTGEQGFIRIWAKASETVTLKLQAVDSVSGTLGSTTESVGTTPTLITLTDLFPLFQEGSSHYIDLITNEASEVMFWSDGLYFSSPSSDDLWFPRDFDDGTAEIELAASYRRPALAVIQDIAESEPRSFLFIWCAGPTGPFERLRFRDKDYRDSAEVEETFSDDGADVPYHDLIYAEHARDRISEAEVMSQGDYEDANESATIWELSPTGQIIPAGETKVFHAIYSQPARDCSLSVNPSGSGDVYSQGTEDGHIHRWENAHPPDANEEADTDDGFLRVGQQKSGSTYHVHRSYVRFDTSGIGAGETVVSATLRLKLKIDGSMTDFGIDVRDNAWGATLAVDDWDGTDTIRGSIETEDLPPADEWVEIDIATAGIQKDGTWTEFEIMSDNEATPPTSLEYVLFWSADSDDPPELVVVLQGSTPESETFENYGVGARIEVEASATNDLVIDVMKVTGYPLRGSTEESSVVEASASPPAIERTLIYALPLQGTRTSSMETEADRLADRYDGRIRRCSLVLLPENDTILTQMLAREIADLIHVENVSEDFSTHIDADFWIEGVEHHIRPGVWHETTWHLEEK